MTSPIEYLPMHVYLANSDTEESKHVGIIHSFKQFDSCINSLHLAIRDHETWNQLKLKTNTSSKLWHVVDLDNLSANNQSITGRTVVDYLLHVAPIKSQQAFLRIWNKSNMDSIDQLDVQLDSTENLIKTYQQSNTLLRLLDQNVY